MADFGLRRSLRQHARQCLLEYANGPHLPVILIHTGLRKHDRIRGPVLRDVKLEDNLVFLPARSKRELDIVGNVPERLKRSSGCKPSRFLQGSQRDFLRSGRRHIDRFCRAGE